MLERLDRLLLASAGVAPGALSFSFRPLWQMDETAKAAVALQKAQATQIYAALGLWPTEVMAGLVAGQLAEDGIYPDAGAAFAAAADASRQPVRDYSPDQPRDPQGRWTEGGGGSAGQSEGAAGENGTAETSRSLTIHPRVSGTTPSEGPASTPESNTTVGILGEIGNALAFLNPITPAHAEEAGPPQARAKTGSSRAGLSGNAPELSNENIPHAPDGTPIELASSRKGRARAIATLLTGAAKLAQKLWEYFESDEPDTPGSVGQSTTPSNAPNSTGTSNSPTQQVGQNPPRLHSGQQDKHIPGTNNYDPTKSILDHPYPQDLLNHGAGTGRSTNGIPLGQPGSRERVDFGQPIGRSFNSKTGKVETTSHGMIHYGKKGAHILPIPPP